MNFRFSAALAACFLPLALPAAPPPSAGRTHVFQHENVLGTSLELRVRASSAGAARAAEGRVLAEIDRLESVVSTYSPASEFSRWQQTRGTAVKLSPELFELLRACDEWRERTGGAFNPGVEAVSRVWKSAAAEGRVPSENQLTAARTAMEQRPWSLDSTSREARHLSDTPLTVNAVAKGFIIDRAGAAGFTTASGVSGLLLNIGGDLRAWGDLVETVDIADPKRDAENAAPFAAVKVEGLALATSGNYRRGVNVSGVHYSHIIDPRTGRPADGVASSSVMARDSATAGVLATIFSIVPPQDIMARAGELLREVEWFLVFADGRTEKSPGWAGRQIPAAIERTAAAPAAETWPADFELLLDFELNRPGSGRYARPYVAAWVEDKDAFPVRTLSLWYMQGQKGQKWVPDLRRWHKSDQMRTLVDDLDLRRTVSSATRQPGKYSVLWDGNDDHKKPVKRGTYTVYLEVVREHGTYQLMKQAITTGAAPSRHELPGNVEIKSATLEYRKRATSR